MASKLGDYLKQIREERGLGIREVARRSKERMTFGGSISPALIVQIESGDVKRPGILKLLALAEIYNVQLSVLTAFLDADEVHKVAERDAENLNRALHEIAETIKISKDLEPHLKSRKESKELQDTYCQLYSDLIETLEGVNFPLVPASGRQPPIPLFYAERVLNENTKEGETRRSVFRLLLALKGWDLDDAAAAFFAAAPRSIRSAVFRYSRGKIKLPTSRKKGVPAKPRQNREM